MFREERPTGQWRVLVPEWTNSIITSFYCFTNLMSRCQNSQSNSQSCKKRLKLLKWNSNQKEIEEKPTKKASPSLSPLGITHTVPWSLGPECCWFQCCKAPLTLAECWMCSFWSCQSLQPQKNQIPSAREQTEHLWLTRWKSICFCSSGNLVVAWAAQSKRHSPLMLIRGGFEGNDTF